MLLISKIDESLIRLRHVAGNILLRISFYCVRNYGTSTCRCVLVSLHPSLLRIRKVYAVLVYRFL